MYLDNDFKHCTRRDWELGTKDVLNFESTMMCRNNVVVMNLHIMDIVFVSLLIHKPFLSVRLLPNSYLFLVQ